MSKTAIQIPQKSSPFAAAAVAVLDDCCELDLDGSEPLIDLSKSLGKLSSQLNGAADDGSCDREGEAKRDPFDGAHVDLTVCGPWKRTVPAQPVTVTPLTVPLTAGLLGA